MIIEWHNDLPSALMADCEVMKASMDLLLQYKIYVYPFTAAFSVLAVFEVPLCAAIWSAAASLSTVSWYATERLP
jgi:hypothetical protein